MSEYQKIYLIENIGNILGELYPVTKDLFRRSALLEEILNIYKEELLDHFKNPRNYGKLENQNFSSGEYNPSCGDSIQIYGFIDNNNMINISFTGKGCVLSQAASSMLTILCLNKSVNEILSIKDVEILKKLNFNIGPNRAKCALLSLHALQKGLKILQ